MPRNVAWVLSGLLLCLAVNQPARARTIAPGQFHWAGAHEVEIATLALRPAFAGDTLASLTTSFIGLNPSIPAESFSVIGVIIQSVVRRHDAGTLDFYYIVLAGNCVEQLFIDGFAGFTADVGLRFDLGGDAAAWLGPGARIGRSASPGGVIDFGNAQFCMNGCAFFVSTNATAYDAGGTMSIVGSPGWSGSASAFRPRPVPLPSAVWAGAILIFILITNAWLRHRAVR